MLSTAIMLFRRFYLSNSVIDFHPRNIAAASALLSAKVDCERNVDVSTLRERKKIVALCVFRVFDIRALRRDLDFSREQR